MKVNKIILLSTILLSLFSCGSNNETSVLDGYKPETELEEVFNKLKNNNFTMDFEDSFVNFDNMVRRETYTYTENSIQVDGFRGFYAYAYDYNNDLVFKYNLVDEEVVPGAPLISSYDGLRYGSVYEVTYGFEDFDISYLPKTKDSDGYYNYEFNKNAYNDILIKTILNRTSATSLDPVSVKMKVVKDVLMVETVLIDNYLNTDAKDTVKNIIYNIGTTSNPEIEKYLKDGKTSKDPLDMKFYKTMNSYLGATNYRIDIYNDSMSESNKLFTEYCTPDSIYDESSNASSGYLKTQGVVVKYNIEDNKVNILETPVADQYNNFYEDIFGDVIYYSFSDITYDSLIGYKDDKNPNLYHLTDSYLIYVIGYLCYLTIDETNYASEILFEIVSDDEFIVTINTIDKETNLKVVDRICKFSELNKVSLPYVDKYLSKGDPASNQTKNDLKEVLDMFSKHNYSFDVLTSLGMSKVYLTDKYYYQEVYGSPNNNFGYIKLGDKVREFTILNNIIQIDETKDYATTSNPINIPSHGDYFSQDTDLSYVSTFDGIYDIDKYVVNEINGLSYWEMTDVQLAKQLYNYMWSSITGIYPYSSGFTISNNGDESKISLISAYILTDGSYIGYESLTFYDINNTSYQLLEDYLNNYIN